MSNFSNDINSFIHDHKILCICTFGLAIAVYALGNLAGRAVYWIRTACGVTNKITSIGSQSIQNNIHLPIKTAVSSRVIFLDIDGVIFNNPSGNMIINKTEELFPEIHYREFRSMHYDTAATHFFNSRAVANLDHLIRETDAKVVISSNWRENRNPFQLKEIFARHTFSQVIIDKTPDKLEKELPFVGRAREIHAWLIKHPEITQFVILDDYDNGFSAGYADNFVQVTAGALLTADDVKKAITILTRKSS